MRYDEPGNVEISNIITPDAEGALAGTYSFSATCGVNGQITVQTRPPVGGLAAENLDYSYDSLRRPIGLVSNLDTYVNTVEYTSLDKLQLLEQGANGTRTWQTFTYEAATQRLKRAATSREDVDGYVRNATHDYDAAGNILSISDVSHDGTDIQCFTCANYRRPISC